jgi:hypothetical protein
VGVPGVEGDLGGLVVAAGPGDEHGEPPGGGAAFMSWRPGGGPWRRAAGRSRCRFG